MTILLATSNPAKIAELKSLLVPLNAEIQTLDAFPGIEDFTENAPTFEANAIGKAKWFCEKTGLPTIADDGGMEIDALEGWPGVHSRRIFGDGRRASDEDLIQEVLRRLEGVPTDRRGANMRTVVAFAAPDRTLFTGEGIDRGVITTEPSAYRIPGFPFRSIFYHPERGMTTAEAVERGTAMADVMTHRRDAVAKLFPNINHWLASQALTA